jgi:hypothetical protein
MGREKRLRESQEYSKWSEDRQRKMRQSNDIDDGLEIMGGLTKKSSYARPQQEDIGLMWVFFNNKTLIWTL